MRLKDKNFDNIFQQEIEGCMVKNVLKIKRPKKDDSLEKIKKTLRAKHACYVLITCSEPSVQGTMEVEMTYEGDETLAAFLVQNASQVFDEKISQRKSK